MTTQTDDRSKNLETTLQMIKKKFGDGAVMSLGQGNIPDVQVISTGALALDLALGIGGLPKGRVTEVFGPESSGKSTLALHAVAHAQANGGVAAYIDAEHALNPEYAAKIGCDLNTLLISQPSSGEEALSIAETLARSGSVDVIVIDSVAALVPKSELEGEMGDSFMGLQARMMSQALRKLTSTLAQTNTAAIFINQIREKIGVFFGNPETTTGGRALKFYSSIRLKIRRIGGIKGAENVENGNRVKVDVVKNKMAPPFRIAEFDILFNEGISRAGNVLDLATACEIVDKKGAWFSYNGDRLGQGRDTVRDLLKSKPQLLDQIEYQVLCHYLGEDKANAIKGVKKSNDTKK